MPLPVIGLYCLPVAYLLILVWLFLSVARKGIVASLACFAASLVAGIWSIRQSHSPGASLGYLILPFQSTLTGLLALAFVYGWRATRLIWRLVARLLLPIIALLIALPLINGKQARQRSREELTPIAPMPAVTADSVAIPRDTIARRSPPPR